MDPDAAVARKAQHQHGLITRAQAREFGISDDSFDWRIRNGIWIPVHRGVVRLPGAPVTWQQDALAPCLAIPKATASHLAAGALWEIPDIVPRPEITVHGRHASLAGVHMHQAKQLSSRDRVWRSGIPVTSLPRTVIDLATILQPEPMRAVVVHLLAKRRLVLSILRTRLQELGTQGRRGAGDLDQMLQELQGRKRHVDSAAQRRLEKLLTWAWKRGLLPEPFFEFPVRLANGKWRFPDGAYPWHFTGVELVSYEHHATLEAFMKDLDRVLDLMEEDWWLVPLTDLHVRTEPIRVVNLIAKVIERQEVRRENRVSHG